MIPFKIDENLHPDVASFLRQLGYDVTTVWDQGLGGAPDATLAEVCRREGRALITLDLDFADIRAYPPEAYHGLIILRVVRQDKRHLLEVLSRMAPLLEKEPLTKHLWIVDEHCIRIRSKSEDT